MNAMRVENESRREKRQRAGAVQDAGATTRPPRLRGSVLDCASPLALSQWRNHAEHAASLPHLSSLLLLLSLLASPLPAAEPKPRVGTDWIATLSGKASDTPVDTGVIGLSADELSAVLANPEQTEADAEVPQDFVRNRRRFVIREMKFNADWDTDPTSLPAMVDQFRRRTGMDAQALQPRKPLTFDDPELFDWPHIFMTAHNAFTLSEAETAGLRRYLDFGGFLHADDCLYGFPFGPAFHSELKKVYPDKELVPLEPAHPVFGTLLKQKFSWASLNEVGLPRVLKQNAFEYLEVGGHLSVLYTPPDLGCMWEISSPPTPSNPLGAGMHSIDSMNPGGREAAYRMGVNIIFYNLTH